ncbi:MAG: HEAT repeat domain-containing protein [Bacteroidales bacterium]|nr:HEAT repeat domain-containing protein [Bacteroidales bacterium]
MRYFTIPKIQRWCEKRDVSRLIDALSSNDSEIRKASVLCLGAFGDAIALESLEFIVENDPDEFVRLNAQKAVLNIQKVGIDSRIKMEPAVENLIYQVNIS